MPPLQFQPPPDWLIQQYMSQPSTGQQILQGAGQVAQAYLQQKNLKRQQQNEALKTYVDAYGQGGRQFATDVGKRAGLIDAPPLPGMTATQTGPGGTAGVMSNQQPVMQPPVSTPPVPTTPTEDASQMSMPSEHVPQPEPTQSLPQQSPIIAHWNSAMGGGQQQAPAQQMGAAPSPAPVQTAAPMAGMQPPTPPARPPNVIGGGDPTALLDQGAWGQKQLAARESLQKLQDTQNTQADKSLENNRGTFAYVRSIAKASGVPGVADDVIANAQAEGRDRLNPVEMKDLQTAISANAAQKRGDSYEAGIDIKRQAQKLAMMKFAMEQTGGKSLQEASKVATDRLAQFKRAQGVLDQISFDGDQASRRQAAEASISTVKGLVGNGVATDSQINEFIPRNLRTKYRDWKEFASSEATKEDFSSFHKELQTLVNREVGINQDIIKSSQDFGESATDLLAESYPSAAAAIRKRGSTNSLISRPAPAAPTAPASGDVPTVSSDAAFNALPSGAQFKDPSGQVHRKK